jgi:hypothetical protein
MWRIQHTLSHIYGLGVSHFFIPNRAVWNEKEIGIQWINEEISHNCYTYIVFSFWGWG